MADEVTIRRMKLADTEAVAALEQAIFARPWSKADFDHELTENKVARYLVAEEDGRVIGYAGAWVILDESHITNIAVREALRGQGIGRMLTQALLQYVSNLGAAYATLEVREHNTPAKSLYTALGFITVGRRKKYYEDNGEDALIMVCDHLPEADPEFEEAETVRED